MERPLLFRVGGVEFCRAIEFVIEYQFGLADLSCQDHGIFDGSIAAEASSDIRLDLFLSFLQILGQFIIDDLELITFLSAQNALVGRVIGVRLEELVRHIKDLVLLDEVPTQDCVPDGVLLMQVETVLQVMVVVRLNAHESEYAVLLLQSESVIMQMNGCDRMALVC